MNLFKRNRNLEGDDSRGGKSFRRTGHGGWSDRDLAKVKLKLTVLQPNVECRVQSSGPDWRYRFGSLGLINDVFGFFYSFYFILV